MFDILETERLACQRTPAHGGCPGAGAAIDLEGLEAWAQALGGRVVAGLPQDLDLSPVKETTQRPFGRELLPWLLGVLVLEFVLRRLLPQRPRFVGAR